METRTWTRAGISGAAVAVLLMCGGCRVFAPFFMTSTAGVYSGSVGADCTAEEVEFALRNAVRKYPWVKVADRLPGGAGYLLECEVPTHKVHYTARFELQPNAYRITLHEFIQYGNGYAYSMRYYNNYMNGVRTYFNKSLLLAMKNRSKAAAAPSAAQAAVPSAAQAAVPAAAPPAAPVVVAAVAGGEAELPYRIVEWRVNSDSSGMQFKAEIKDQGALDAIQCEKLIERSIARKLADEFVQKNPSCSRESVHVEFTNTRFEHPYWSCSAYAFSVVPEVDGLEYNDVTKTGVISVSLRAGDVARARQWAVQNIGELVNTKNVALRSGTLPRGKAAFVSEDEKVHDNGRRLVIRFRALD